MFERLARGWTLTKASLHVLRLDTEILVLPVLSGLVMVLLAAGVFVPLVAGAAGGAAYDDAVWLGASLLVYFLGYFVVIFFNVAVVAMAGIRFDGGDPVVKDGLRVARENLGLIAQWALVAATVGLLLRMLRGQMRQRWGPLLDMFLGGALEVAWNALIYFVVPLLVYRKLGPVQAMRESVNLIRRSWGETIGGEVSMGLVFMALGLLGLVAMVGAVMLGGGVLALLVVLAVLLYWVVLAVVYTAAQGVLTAALYKYATTGQVPQGFDASTMARAIS